MDSIAGGAEEGGDELPLVGPFAVGEADLACLPSWQADGQHLLQLAAATQRLLGGKAGDILCPAAEEERTIPKNGIVLRLHG